MTYKVFPSLRDRSSRKRNSVVQAVEKYLGYIDGFLYVHYKGKTARVSTRAFFMY